jgi:hypothetical protein
MRLVRKGGSELRSARRGVLGALGIVSLLLVLELNSAYASTPTAFTLNVSSGTVTNIGNQTYNFSGGYVVEAVVGNETLDAGATLTFTVSAQVDGLSTSGSATFDLTGMNGSTAVTANGSLSIDYMYAAEDFPSGCTTTCNSALPLFFMSSSSATYSIGGVATNDTSGFDLESPYFNPWGAPIVLVSNDGNILIVATYAVGTIQWSGTQIGGSITGSLGGSSVTGIFNDTSQESEDLVAGTANDSGTTALTGMSPSFLDVSGTYSGTSTIPTPGGSDCSTELMIPGITYGVCTETGFDSTGSASMQNSQVSVTGSYDTTWAVPAIDFTSVLSLDYEQDPGCTSAVIQASPDQVPTIGLDGPSSFSTPNATNTVSFYVTQPDAVPASWLTGSCIGQDTSSFSSLNVTRVAFSVDGGPLQDAQLSFSERQQFECFAGNAFSIISDWESCTGSISVVQVWSGSFTFTVMPTGLHSIVLEAWGQDGAGPFTTDLAVYHSLVSYSGQPFTIKAADLAGTPVVVTMTGEEPMLTSSGTVMIPVHEVYNTIVPASGVIVGSFLENGNVTISSQSASSTWHFRLGDSPSSVQALDP